MKSKQVFVLLCTFVTACAVINAHARTIGKPINQITDYDISKIAIVAQSSAEIHYRVRDLAANLGDPISTKCEVDAILSNVYQGAKIDGYDALWLSYALLKFAYVSSGSGLSEQDDLMAALSVLNYLNDHGVDGWHYTEEGQFKMEVYRTASNSAAWSLRERRPEQALRIIERALPFFRDEDLFMYDTYVRVLLNLEQGQDKAFKIVKRVLKTNPGFVDFQDFSSNQAYLSWLENH